MYKCIIIDDESHAIQLLEYYIGKTPDLELIQSFTDPLEALTTIISNDPVDLIIVDVNMPQISGIDLAREIRNKTDKLFISSGAAEYGYQAFEVNADAYLLKPYNFAKFISTVNKAFEYKTKLKENTKTEDYFFVKSKEDNLKLVKVAYRDVIAVESLLNYVLIHTTSRKIITYMSLMDMLSILKEYPGFIQFHRSYIVGLNYINNIDGNIVNLENGISIAIGGNYRKDFKDFISKRLLKPDRKYKL